MTFELTRNYERAGIEYRNANTLATALRAAMLKDPSVLEPVPGEGGDSAMHPLKHLNILFQPFFAEAWIAEKLAGAVDTGVGLVEKELWALRSQLPFVNDLQASPAKSPINVKASNFSLIMAELHNKAGDLYFFKGRQRVTTKGLEGMIQRMNERTSVWGGHEGYLLRAHYHYAVALQEMRRLISYRRESSPYKVGIQFTDGSTTGRSIETENWPDFLYRSIGGALNDLAEATLGRVSIYGLLRELPSSRSDDINREFVKNTRGTLVKALVQWMESITGWQQFSFSLPCPADGQELRCWLGHWTGRSSVSSRKSPHFPLIDFKRTDHQDDFHRLMVALQFKMGGSKMLEKGGYIEGAAHDLLGVCEIITHYLWWLLTLDKLRAWRDNAVLGNTFIQLLEERGDPFDLIRDLQRGCKPYYLVGVALYCLEKADRLFRLGRKAEEAGREYLVGNQIPVAQLLLTYSLGLAISHWEPNGSLPEKITKLLTKLLAGWGLEVEDEKGRSLVSRVSLRKFLEEALVRHSYPMVNRLQGLKVLIDDTLLDDTDNTLHPDWEPWSHELIRLTGELDVPMHFTPLHSGVTYALAYCRRRIRDSRDGQELTKIRSAAQRDLETSEEMFTLRRAYYENISDLSYLYDDFNDRQLHLSHGIQMAGAEINALFKYLVTVDDQG